MIHFHLPNQKVIHTNGLCPSKSSSINLNGILYRVKEITHKISISEYNRQSLLLHASTLGKKFSADPAESFNESLEFLESITKGTFNGFNKDKTAFLFSLHDVDITLEEL